MLDYLPQALFVAGKTMRNKGSWEMYVEHTLDARRCDENVAEAFARQKNWSTHVPILVQPAVVTAVAPWTQDVADGAASAVHPWNASDHITLAHNAKGRVGTAVLPDPAVHPYLPLE